MPYYNGCESAREGTMSKHLQWVLFGKDAFFGMFRWVFNRKRDRRIALAIEKIDLIF